MGIPDKFRRQITSNVSILNRVSVRILVYRDARNTFYANKSKNSKCKARKITINWIIKCKQWRKPLNWGRQSGRSRLSLRSIGWVPCTYTSWHLHYQNSLSISDRRNRHCRLMLKKSGYGKDHLAFSWLIKPTIIIYDEFSGNPTYKILSGDQQLIDDAGDTVVLGYPEIPFLKINW